MQDIWVNIFRIRCENLTFNVNHDRIQMDLNSPKRDNSFSGTGWEAFGNEVGVVNDQIIIFTNWGNNNLSVVVIGADGLGLTREEIFPTMIRRNPRPIDFRDRKGNVIQPLKIKSIMYFGFMNIIDLL